MSNRWPENVWVERTVFGQGSHGHRCTLCGADDWPGTLEHKPGCPAERYLTREALFAAVAGAAPGPREVKPKIKFTGRPLMDWFLSQLARPPQ